MDQTNAEIATFFHNVEAHGWRPELGTAARSAAFDIIGVGYWFVTMQDGKTTVLLDCRPTSPPDVIFTLRPETFLRIVDQKDPLNPTTAALQGLLDVDGDPNLGWAMLVENIEG